MRPNTHLLATSQPFSASRSQRASLPVASARPRHYTVKEDDLIPPPQLHLRLGPGETPVPLKAVASLGGGSNVVRRARLPGIGIRQPLRIRRTAGACAADRISVRRALPLQGSQRMDAPRQKTRRAIPILPSRLFHSQVSREIGSGQIGKKRAPDGVAGLSRRHPGPNQWVVSPERGVRKDQLVDLEVALGVMEHRALLYLQRGVYP